MELAVFNQQGQDTGRKIALNEEVFGITPNENAVYLDVKQFLANQRQGTHKSKERSEVSGSTRKLHKQKGGGGSRIGDINSPVLVGGGRVFGPRPRDYRFKLNKKVKDLARRSAWSAKAADGQIIVVDDIKFEAPKTKEFVQFAKSFNLEGKKVLVVTADKNDNLYLAIRNVPGARVMSASDVNTYSILDNVAIIVTESGLAVINNK
ncbi:MAG: 50S ribosomal protein L4 [Bacteroides sp.]|nr:50S ribosomal protein L4 [Bacteroides sp.]MCM1457058.1 50S ribosomal protein L4 [Lachnoclostridium sp.]